MNDFIIVDLCNVGRVFPEMRDEIGVVFPLEFPECKGMRLYPPKAGPLPNQIEQIGFPFKCTQKCCGS